MASGAVPPEDGVDRPERFGRPGFGGLDGLGVWLVTRSSEPGPEEYGERELARHAWRRRMANEPGSPPSAGDVP